MVSLRVLNGKVGDILHVLLLYVNKLHENTKTNAIGSFKIYKELLSNIQFNFSDADHCLEKGNLHL